MEGVITVKAPGSQDIIVRMDEYGSSQIMCAIAMMENVNNETFSVEKLVKFYSSHQMMDQTFQWGLKWVAGSKS
jgi:tellurite resistance protein TerA